ncbi:hypothetical protein ASPFODRAFT_37756 [Aspergillus luchuensis CBS 106.47]|uniref:Uncharacterized protein n=1 Tax=Aspergillus luchuensis (strain CBS 106.47) TaxID=1137211 RepID=A0A1M3T3S6_ASPLC|nr:hypothetical protein ASPFODRAFT_37756 [Aspergillus luchuensis CBS 106.47]
MEGCGVIITIVSTNTVPVLAVNNSRGLEDNVRNNNITGNTTNGETVAAITIKILEDYIKAGADGDTVILINNIGSADVQAVAVIYVEAISIIVLRPLPIDHHFFESRNFGMLAGKNNQGITGVRGVFNYYHPCKEQRAAEHNKTIIMASAWFMTVQVMPPTPEPPARLVIRLPAPVVARAFRKGGVVQVTVGSSISNTATEWAKAVTTAKENHMVREHIRQQ